MTKRERSHLRRLARIRCLERRVADGNTVEASDAEDELWRIELKIPWYSGVLSRASWSDA